MGTLTQMLGLGDQLKRDCYPSYNCHLLYHTMMVHGQGVVMLSLVPSLLRRSILRVCNKKHALWGAVG